MAWDGGVSLGKGGGAAMVMDDGDDAEACNAVGAYDFHKAMKGLKSAMEA